MPELPEVETVRRALAGSLGQRRLIGWELRNPNLRWPVSIPDSLRGARLQGLGRVAKYLLFEFDTPFPRSCLIAHLGMSGSFRLLGRPRPPERHDHLDLHFEGVLLRYNDPRRFGSLHYQRAPVHQHFLLKNLGVEPLSDDLSGDYLFEKSRKRRVAVKQFIMDGRLVTGIGNIYASEALFEAGIRPTTAAGRIGRRRYQHLSQAIKHILARAIEKGGTTLRDFSSSDGQPGYFARELKVYDRAGEACGRCGGTIKRLAGGRSTYYCPGCQK